MTTADARLALDWLDELVETTRQGLDIPGVSVAVLHDGQVATSVSGVANLHTGAPVTADTRFLIGSISKVVTCTLLLQHVDRGEVDLDAPVRTWLPGFRLADEDAAAKVTVRHLLTHSSGIEGDHFRHFGRGDEAIDAYVESLERIGLIHDVGEMFSYCNAGWVVAGRLLEVLRGRRYRDILKADLLPALGMTSTTTAPEETILHHPAVGHVEAAEGGLRVTSTYELPPSMGPAGTVICSTPRDLLRFGELHMNDGVAADGSQLLSPDLVKLMRTPQVAIPAPGRNAWMGHGWVLFEQEGTTFATHSGGTTGQFSQLAISPDHGFAVASQTNGPNGRMFNQAVANEISSRLVRTKVFGGGRPLGDPPIDLDLSKYVGTYERLSARAEVVIEDDALVITQAPTTETTSDDGDEVVQVLRMTPLDDVFFAARKDGSDAILSLVAFLAPDEDGRPKYAYAGRLARRVPDEQ